MGLGRPGIRSVYYVLGYWMLNVVLVIIEARWHPIYRLMLWDISQLQSLAPMLANLARVVQH